ncbi:MAG TPA: PPE domain-containing protein [Pseudonocardiaceae bacterium]|nr:PPE domain-containing protein [Pseudonocardiaceae bacterium]
MGTDFNYDDTSHQVIFDHINGGSGSGALQDISQAWQKLGNEIGATGKSFVQSTISRILATREGAAAQASVSAVGAMVPWMDNVTQVAAKAAQRAQEQADYWVTAKNSVPPVPPAPKSTGFFSDPAEWAAEKIDWFPGVTSEEEKAQKRQQDAAEQARQAMRVYQASSNPNIDAAPAFTAPQTLDGSVGSLPLTSASIGAASMAPAMAGGGGPAHVMAAHQPAIHQAPAQPVAYQPGATPPAATVSQLTPAGPAGPAAGVALPGQWASNPTPNEGLTSGPLVPSAGVGGSNTARPMGTRGGPGGTRLTGAGRANGANHAGFGPRPSAELGTRTTAGSHLSLDEMSEARGGASSTRGAGGAGYGQPFAGGGSQPSEQDREHRSKYLLHDDSNAIVGDLPPTAPPVIGADY